MKVIKSLIQPSWLSLNILLLVLALVTADCSLKLVADYDEVTDKEVSQLQRKIDSFLVHIQRNVGIEEAEYSKHAKFYEEARVDVSAIQVRAAARPKNQITLDQLQLLQESLDDLEQLHKLGFQDQQEIEPLRSAFNTIFTAILKLELAKKRGE